MRLGGAAVDVLTFQQNVALLSVTYPKKVRK